MSDVFPARNITYDELTSWAGAIGIVEDQPATEFLNYINTNYPDADKTNAMLDYSRAYLDFNENADGTYNVWGYKTNYGTSTQYNPVNSNSGQVARAEFRQAVNSGTTVSEGKTVKNFSTQPASGGFAQNAVYVLSEIGAAVSAASVGVALGKWIDKELYNANPDYWDSIGLSSLNPETWNSLTAGSDSPFAGMLNAILGINPSTGQSQMYIDQEAFAYCAMALAMTDWFASTNVIENPSYSVYPFTNPHPEFITGGNATIVSPTSDGGSIVITVTSNAEVCAVAFGNEGSGVPYIPMVVLAKKTSGAFSGNYRYTKIRPDGTSSVVSSGDLSNSFVRQTTLQNKYAAVIPVAVSGSSVASINNFGVSSAGDNRYNTLNYRDAELARLGWMLLYDGYESTSIPGTSNQPNATLPDVSTWDTPANTLSSLQQQYPNIFDNPLTFESMQPDGTVIQHKYVPVTMPNILYNNDPQPTATTQLQGQTLVDPTTSTDTLLQLLTDLVTATQTQTQPQEQIPPDNPVDTGTGSSPVPTPPTGSASALWSVYHPTQAQVDAFGGWLWSTNFVDQLIKVFENPMDAIISLHKVFIMPVDAGNTTIHAGYLDSNVPSAYVTQQYVYADCGYINCYEQFGNVFDYVGTTLSLYLPFIGIVPLNVDDVMRSTIHVIYGCDLFTGAILAQVEIQRDGHNAVLYQYGGDGAVMYPVSGSRSSSFLTGLMATLGAAASVAVTGGASIPIMAAGVGGAIASAQKQVQRSGGFSGNSGAMGCKVPYLIIERPQTKIASIFPRLEGYPTNYSVVLGNCSNHVVCSSVHVHGITATQPELEMIEEFLRSGVEI